MYNYSMSKLSTEEFVTRAEEIHGKGKYNYAKSEYIDSHTKLVVTCPVHGDFLVTPANHLYNKRGCPKCSSEIGAERRKLSKETVISRAMAVHGDRYDYSKFEYNGMLSKSIVICPIHGEFEITPAKHISKGQGCSKCTGAITCTEDFIRKAVSIHGDKYDYSKSVYKTAKDKVCVICPVHGPFQILPRAHVYNGTGCPSCSYGRLSLDQFIDAANKIHNNKYNYSKVSFKTNSNTIKVICPRHGTFIQTVKNHLKQHIACPKCRAESKMNISLFIEKSNTVHCNRYLYDKVVYNGANTPVVITCPVHGEFTQTPHNHMAGHGCPKCKTITSSGESDLVDFIKSLGFSTKLHNRSVLAGKELDIYIPEKKLAIEYDGLYWHSSNFKENTYHVNKTDVCLSRGVTLLHVFEDEWVSKRRIVESRIRHMLGVQGISVYARKCVVSKISYSLAEKFCNKYHLQGACPSSVNLGLFYNGRPVAVMTFGKPRFSKAHSWELLRYCSLGNVSVVGGAGKLLAYFRKHYQGSIITYADRRWSNGNLYRKLGMTELKKSKPAYYYIKNGIRYNRVTFQKHKLDKLLPVFNSSISEAANMKHNGYYKLYDCGCYRFELT